MRIENEEIDKNEEIEEVEEVEENKESDKEISRISIINNKTSDLYEKLVEIQEKLQNEELSPIKRLLIQTKLSIIETQLNRQLAKLQLIEAENIYKDRKGERYLKHNEDLEVEQQEYDMILDRKYFLEREIEEISTEVKNREKEYEEINNSGNANKNFVNPIQAKKDKDKNIYRFSVDNSKSNIVKPESLKQLEEKQEELEAIKQEQEDKKNHIINLKNEFEEQEKEFDTQVSEVLTEYKPTLWRTIKFAAFKIRQNFREWRDNSKLEKQQIKEAQQKAREEVRKESSQRKNKSNERISNDLKEQFERYGSLDKYNEKVSTREKLGMDHIEIENLDDEEPDLNLEQEKEIEELFKKIHEESSFDDKEEER